MLQKIGLPSKFQIKSNLVFVEQSIPTIIYQALNIKIQQLIYCQNMELSQPLTSLETITQQKSKISIINYASGSAQYYITLCEKKPENVGFNHPRLLVLEEVQGIIYYVNCPDKWPLKDQNISTPKNQKVPLNLCQVKNQSGNELTISYNKKSDKDKVVAGQWIFVMETKNLARQWVSLVFSKKNQKVMKAILNSPSNLKEQTNQAQVQVQEQPPNKIEDRNTLNPNTGSKIGPNMGFQPQANDLKNSSNKEQLNTEDKSKIKRQQLKTQKMSKVEDNKMSESKNNQVANQNRYPNEIGNSKVSNQNSQAKFILNQPTDSNNRNRESSANLMNSSQIKHTQINIKNPPEQKKQSTISGLNNRTSISNQLTSEKKESKTFVNQLNRSEVKKQQKSMQESQKPRIQTFSQEPPKNNSYRQNPMNVSKRNEPQAYKKQSGEKLDWNMKFLQERTEKTIKDYSQFCLQAFMSFDPENINLRAETESKDQEVMPRKFNKQGISFYMAEYGTKAAQNLRRQFKNYHYILESCRENKIIHVPMACLIQYVGIICLAKANFAEPYQIIDLFNNSDPIINQQLRSLEAFTKISSESIKKSGVLANLTKRYGKQGKNDRIFIDNLVEYLPRNPECNGSAIRPELILDNFSKTIHPRSPEYQTQISSTLSNSVHKLSELLSQHELTIASYNDLKDILHDFGLNINMTPGLYNFVRSKFVKRYLYTAMVCAIAKEDIILSIVQMREAKEISRLLDGIQQIFRIYFEAHHNDPAYVELWKNLATEFKKKYRLNFNMNEIQPGFFLSSVMSIINGEYDIEKIDKSKLLLEQKNIIGKGFILELKPIVKNYSNYCTQKSQKVINICKYPIRSAQQITNIMPYNEINERLSQKQRKQIHARLSCILSPFSSHNQQMISNIYSVVNQEPPCLTSHSTTVSYADHCQREGRTEEFKQTMETAVDVVNYWLGEEHILLCDIFESLADYYQVKGQVQDCINYMKFALTTCIRQTGTHTHRAGLQYFKLAEKQLKYGENKDAMQNYEKFKNNAQTNPRRTIHYPIAMMRLGNLELNQGHVEKCIVLCIKAIKCSEQIQIPDSTLIKMYDLLCRAYELNQNRQQLINLSHLAAKMFNSTTNSFAFDQMIRICLVGFVGALQPGKQDKFIQYIRINKDSLNQSKRTKEATDRLMDIAASHVVMQKFYKGIQDVDRYISEIRHGRHQSGEAKQFKLIFQNILQIVGLDFVEGILQQSQYW